MWIVIDVVLATAILLAAMGNCFRVGSRVLHDIDGRQPDLIAPFSISGEEIKDSNYGQKLADMLVARFQVLSKDLKDSVITFNYSALRPTSAPDAPEVLMKEFVGPQVVNLLSTKLKGLSLPVSTLNPPQIAANFKGFDFGPFLRWGFYRLFDERLVQISIHRGESWLITANFDGPNGTATVLPVQTKSDLAAIDEIVRYYWRRELVKIHPKIDALTASEFTELADLIQSYALNQKREGAGRFDLSAWTKVAEEARKIAGLTPSWAEIQLVAGASTMRTLNLPSAIEYYAKAKSLYQQQPTIDKNTIDNIDKIIASLSDINVNDFVTHEIEAAEKLLLQVLSVEGGPITSSATRPKIAVVGGLPPAAIFQLQGINRVGPTFSSDAQYYKDDWHAGNVAKTVQLTLGGAGEILVAAMHGTDENEALINNAKTLLAAGPSIMAIAYSGKLEGVFPQGFMQVIADAVSKGVVVVFPLAGNQEGSNVTNVPILSNETGRFMIVSGVDAKGRKTTTSKSAPDAFWLPALGIPAFNEEGAAVYGQGVSFSVGLAAGVVGRLMAKFPNAKAETILSVLKKTASPIADGGKSSENVVNVKQAEQQLSKQN